MKWAAALVCRTAIKGLANLDRLPSLLPRFVAAVLGLALSVQCAVALKTLLPESHKSAGLASNAPLPRTRSRSPIDVQLIVRSHLFGVPAPDPADAAAAPDTQQRMVLTATFAMTNPKRGFAILGDSAQSARFHAVGAAVAGGVILDQVYEDRVILSRDGALETLRMPINHPTIESAKEAAPTLARSIASPGDGEAGATADTSNRPVPMKMFQLLPVFGQRDHGARIGMPRNPRQLAEMGLNAGDIITEVNGTHVTSAQGTADLLHSLGKRVITLTVERGTQTQEIQVNSVD
jgi:general secretion pathway protein C